MKKVSNMLVKVLCNRSRGYTGVCGSLWLIFIYQEVTFLGFFDEIANQTLHISLKSAYLPRERLRYWQLPFYPRCKVVEITTPHKLAYFFVFL